MATWIGAVGGPWAPRGRLSAVSSASRPAPPPRSIHSFFFSSPFTVVVRPSREPWSALSRRPASCTGWARAPWPTWPCAPRTRSSGPSRCGAWATRPASARGSENGQVSGPPRPRRGPPAASRLLQRANFCRACKHWRVLEELTCSLLGTKETFLNSLGLVPSKPS